MKNFNIVKIDLDEEFSGSASYSHWGRAMFPQAENSYRGFVRKLLLQAASRAAIDTDERARGKCFSMSVNFATAFCHCADLHLIRWKVTDDPHYCEHWSIEISPNEVIDLTRVQVDGKTEVLHEISSYPVNYIQMRRYPVSIVSSNDSSQQKARSSKWAPMKMRWAMFRCDIAGAPSGSEIRVFAKGVLELIRFAGWLALNNLLHLLRERQSLLKERLQHD